MPDSRSTSPAPMPSGWEMNKEGEILINGQGSTTMTHGQLRALRALIAIAMLAIVLGLIAGAAVRGPVYDVAFGGLLCLPLPFFCLLVYVTPVGRRKWFVALLISALVLGLAFQGALVGLAFAV